MLKAQLSPPASSSRSSTLAMTLRSLKTAPLGEIDRMTAEQADGSNYRDDSKTIDVNADGSNYRDDSETIGEDENADGSNYRDDSKGISEVADGSNYREPTS